MVDNECFKWFLVRYVNRAHHCPARTTKADKNLAKNFDFKSIKFPVKVRDIHKIENKNSVGISVFGYENKEKHPTYVSKNCFEGKHINLLLIEQKKERDTMFLSTISIYLCIVNLYT